MHSMVLLLYAVEWCLSIHPSITCMYCVETTEPINALYLGTLVYGHQTYIFRGSPHWGITVYTCVQVDPQFHI